jgi:hypothetical protein
LKGERVAIVAFGAALAGAAAVASSVAFFLTWSGCSGAGTLGTAEPGVSRSGYCQALGLPASYGNAGATALAVILFGLPLLISVGLTVTASMRRDARLVTIALRLCGILVTGLFVMLAFANSQFAGAV